MVGIGGIEVDACTHFVIRVIERHFAVFVDGSCTALVQDQQRLLSVHPQLLDAYFLQPFLNATRTRHNLSDVFADYRSVGLAAVISCLSRDDLQVTSR